MLLRKIFRSFKCPPGCHSFSTKSSVHNPFYILGVDKNMSFDDIKKQYYKLAAEFHPDINKSPEAGKQFLTIKEAFETIKMMHGKAVKMDFEGGSTRQRTNWRSVRPNPEQYSDDFDRDEYKTRDESDYKEWAYKASQSEEHEKFSDSFETINSIKDIKFRPDDVPVPDASARFKLHESKGHMFKFSDRSVFFLVLVFGGFLAVFYWANAVENSMIDNQMENTTYNLKHKEEYNRLSLDEHENLVKSISINLRQTQDYVDFAKKFEDKSNIERNLRNKFAPQPVNFVVLGVDD